MYEVNINKKKSTATLVLNGALTIQNIEAIKDTFSRVVSCNKIIINQAATEEFDLSYLQLVISLKKSMDKANKKLEVGGKQFINAVKTLGYNYDIEFTRDKKAIRE